jgi:hypothetical protein
MDLILISAYHNEPHSRRLTGIDITVDYSGRQAEISVFGIPPLSADAQDHGIRAELGRLAEAILNATRNPKGIIAQSPKRD